MSYEAQPIPHGPTPASPGWQVVEGGRSPFYGTEGQCRDWAWLMNFARQTRVDADQMGAFLDEMKSMLLDPHAESER